MSAGWHHADQPPLRGREVKACSHMYNNAWMPPQRHLLRCNLFWRVADVLLNHPNQRLEIEGFRQARCHL